MRRSGNFEERKCKVPRKVDKGQLFECRVARLLAAEGAFVRRRVNLDAQFGERFTITDVDVFSFFFSPTLHLRKVVGECKTTEAKNAPSAGDRLLWSAGLAQLVGAETTFVAVMKRARDSERRVASLVGSEIIDIRDIERREQVLGIDAGGPYGPHDPRLGILREQAKQIAKADESLRRFERFVTSELWLTPPVLALKKALGAARRLSERWSPQLPDTERSSVEWMVTEAIVGAILALTQLASLGYRQPEDVLAQSMHERLAEGLADYQALRQMSRQIDKVFVATLTKLGVDPARAAEATGLFEPQAPTYTEPLTELVERLARQPAATARLTCLADTRYAAFLGADGSIESQLGDITDTSRLLRLVATFMEGQIGVPEALLQPLRQPLERAETASNGQNAREVSEQASSTLFSESGDPSGAAKTEIS
jgi:hypothetical protein